MTPALRAEALLYDVRFALRALTRRPALAIIATVSLAIGIAINVAFFTVMNAMLLRDLGVPDAGSLVLVGNPMLTFGQYRALREELAPRGEAFAFAPYGAARIDDVAPEVATEVVSDSYFAALGLHAAAGRLFSPGDAAPEEAGVVLSDFLWRRSYGRDPAVVGRTIRLAGRPVRVEGVAPPDFRGLVPFSAADVWTLASPALTQRAAAAPWNAALRPGAGVPPREARAATVSAVRHLPGLDAATLRSVHVDLVSDIGRLVWLLVTVLMAVPGLVLLVACANVSGLLAARAEERREEMAIRLAVGGNRMRLVRQLLSEGGLLALGGAALGLLMGRWIVDGLCPWLLPTLARFAMHPDLSLDRRAVAVALSLSFVAALVSSLLPALAASRHDVSALLKREPGTRPAGRWPLSSRDLLVVAQLVVTFAFLVTSVLCTRTFRSGLSMPLGFAPERLLAATVRGPEGPRQAQGPVFDAFLERVRRIPGVTAATIAQAPPAMPGPRLSVRDAGALDGAAQSVACNRVRPEYLSLAGLRLLEGRFLDETDVRAGRSVTVVSAALARRLWGETADPLGHALLAEGDARPLEVVGMVDDPVEVAQVERRPGSRGEPILYAPLDAEHLRGARAVVLLVEGTQAALLAPAVEKAAREIAPGMALLRATTLADLNRAGLVQAEITMVLYTFLGILCGALGAVGLYGAIAQLVARRTREIGLRMALGATRGDVLGLVLRRGLALGAAGVVLGVPAAYAAARIFGSAVLDMPSVDLPTLALVAPLVFLTALTASYVPARRASGVDPMTALRHE
jgi:putative ABC transport system permease protein